MGEDRPEQAKSGLVRSLFKAVGRAGSTVGGVAFGCLRSAAQTAKGAGDRASLTFSKPIDSAPELSLRELAEQLTQWLVQEHEGSAELQRQKASTVELAAGTESSEVYHVVLEEPGLTGRAFRFLLRESPISEWERNFPKSEVPFHSQALLVLSWPSQLEIEPQEQALMIWDQVAVVGERNSAVDLLQHWVRDTLGGTFAQKRVLPKKRPRPARPIPSLGRERQLEHSREMLLTPTDRRHRASAILSLAAPGGTGKSYFLKVLRAQLSYRLLWAEVDHQSIDRQQTAVETLVKLLSVLAQQLRLQSLPMPLFSKALHEFRGAGQTGGEKVSSGFLGHVRKAAASAAAINPIFGVANAGVAFLASWTEQARGEAEALAKDDAIKALTYALKTDLLDYAEQSRELALAWPRPVLVFDTYEWLAPLVDSWVRTDLLDGGFLESGCCVLLFSGRESLLRTDTRWSEWQHQMTVVELQPFDRATTEVYLADLKVEAERFEALYELTGGLPLFLALVAHIKDPDQAVSCLAERVLEEVPREHRDDFLMASLLDSFDTTSLAGLFTGRTSEELSALATLLTHATFTVARDGRRVFLESVRKVLRRALELQLGSQRVQELETSLRS